MKFTVEVSDDSLPGIAWAREQCNMNPPVEGGFDSDADYLNWIVNIWASDYTRDKKNTAMQQALAAAQNGDFTKLDALRDAPRE